MTAARERPTEPRIIPGRIPRVLYTNVDWDQVGEYDDPGGDATTDPNIAELVSSEIGNGIHAPVLDLDVPATLVPSTTQGHSHLYIDVPMTWEQYQELLLALMKAGILEMSYYCVSRDRARTQVRVPWVRKPTN